MISVVCVYNDEEMLAARLLKSLREQTAAHEVIAVDNRAGRFESGAAALNHGARQAKGEWLAFAHQDVSFIAADWLARAEVMAARKHEDASWADVGQALGINRQAAHERFRTGPDGMHSRLFLRTSGRPSP